jgi:hypothetical protein
MFTIRRRHLVPPVLLVFFLSAGCGTHADTATNAMPSAPSPNTAILDEMTQAHAWFHAKRVRPIWAKLLDKDQKVQTIEGTEEIKAGVYLCRGEAGEVWPQTALRLLDKYEKTDEVDAEGWRKYVPRADNQGVMAAQVKHAFTVHAKWGVLSGKAGDYIVKDFSNRDVAHPDDVWIVDQKLFQATYKAVEGK